MKKVMLLSLSILGITHLANAWVKTPPQIWKAGAMGGSNVICFDTEVGFCMSGDGSNPYNGQSCIIWTRDGKYIGSGMIIKSSSTPESPDDENTEVEAVITTDYNHIPH
ncbi:hypothetical protein D9M68_696180 [compost metagenome]